MSMLVAHLTKSHSMVRLTSLNICCLWAAKSIQERMNIMNTYKRMVDHEMLKHHLQTLTISLRSPTKHLKVHLIASPNSSSLLCLEKIKQNAKWKLSTLSTICRCNLMRGACLCLREPYLMKTVNFTDSAVAILRVSNVMAYVISFCSSTKSGTPPTLWNLL